MRLLLLLLPLLAVRAKSGVGGMVLEDRGQDPQACPGDYLEHAGTERPRTHSSYRRIKKT